MKNLSFFSFALLILLINSCQKPTIPLVTALNAEKDFSEIKTKEEAITYMLTGYFTSEEQGSTKRCPLYATQHYVGRRIWLQRADEYWVATYRFRDNNKEVPISQLILNIKRKNRDTTSMTIYNYPDNKKYNLEWTKEIPFADLAPKDLISTGGCQSYFFTNDRQSYQMKGDKSLCFLDLSDAIPYVKMDAEIFLDSIHYKAMFYDKSKVFRLGYQEEALKFKRVPTNSIAEYLEKEEEEEE